MSDESLLVILLIGLIAGWLAGHFVRGTGYPGLIADIAIGIVGALIGSWLLPRLGIPPWCRHRPRHHRRHYWRRGTPNHSQVRLQKGPMVSLRPTNSHDQPSLGDWTR
jgi:uncharacterized membrane protein YeaQ/YmgE (transglycosylase-associated protein family)